MIGWGWVLAGAVAFAVVLYLLRPRHRGGISEWPGLRPGERMVRLDGPPVTREMQLLFGAYGGSEVVGIVQLQEGLRVNYRSGLQISFVPVPDNATLYVRPEDGRYAVVHGGDRRG